MKCELWRINALLKGGTPRAITGALLAFVGLLLWGESNFHCGVLAKPPYPNTNLLSFIAKWKPTEAALGTVCRLAPQWVGTVKRTYLRGGEGIYKEDKPQSIRFSHLMVLKKMNERTNLTIVRGRITRGGEFGSYNGAEAPVFMSNLPSIKVVSEARNLDDLRRMFGRQHGWTDGWGDEHRMHWTEGWTCFTAESTNRLRYLRVFAHVSAIDHQKPADIDIMAVTEGLFRPADPYSIDERKTFRTGEEVNEAYETSRAQDRAKYPLPLRALVEARETPDDSDLVAYKHGLSDIRRMPSSELFRQLEEWFHDGTREIGGMLENLLFDDFLQLPPWQQEKRKLALKALTEALPM